MSSEQWGEAVDTVANMLAQRRFFGLSMSGEHNPHAGELHFAAQIVREVAEPIVTDTRRRDRDALIRVLFRHHRKTRTDDDGIAGRCVCGWGRPGDAFPLHIADELDAAIARGIGPTDPPAPAVDYPLVPSAADRWLDHGPREGGAS